VLRLRSVLFPNAHERGGECPGKKRFGSYLKRASELGFWSDQTKGSIKKTWVGGAESLRRFLRVMGTAVQPKHSRLLHKQRGLR